MTKPLVRSLWLASILALPTACAFGDDPPMLAHDAFKKPTTVSAWLKQNGDKADKAKAKMFFDAGVKANNQKRYGPAGKAFGESAVYYPTPEAMREYADITLRTLGKIRGRDKDRAQQMKSDLSSALSLYQSALASDEVCSGLICTDTSIGGKSTI